MARGSDTLQGIETAIANLNRRESELSRDLETANAARAEKLRERAQLLSALAKLRVQSALADGVIDEADRLESEVAFILATRQRVIADLTQRKQDAMERQQDLLAQSSSGLEESARMEAELDALAERAQASLATDAGYSETRAQRDALAGQLEKAAAKVLQAEADRKEKGAPYEADPLFMYLWRRNYRGAQYAPGSFIRWLDDWVAGLVRYNEARANYALLNEIPVRLAAHVERLDGEHANASEVVQAMEAERMAALDDSGVEVRLRELRHRQKEIDGELSAAEAEVHAAASDLNRHARGEDESYKQTIAMLTDFLERQRYNRLLDEARATPETADDEILATYAGINRDIGKLDGETRENSKELEKLAKRREELVRVAADFRRKSYHQPGSVFEPDFDLEDLLEDVVKGVLTGAEYWIRTRGRQKWNGRSGDGFRRRSGFPPFDFGDSGWAGGRSKRRRRDDDDDWFRTGGGF